MLHKHTPMLCTVFYLDRAVFLAQSHSGGLPAHRRAPYPGWLLLRLEQHWSRPAITHLSHTHTYTCCFLWQPHVTGTWTHTVRHSLFFHPVSLSFVFSPLRLTCSLLQLSAADTMISSSLKRTSESLFRQTAEVVCTFLVSHNYKKTQDRKQT